MAHRIGYFPQASVAVIPVADVAAQRIPQFDETIFVIRQVIASTGRVGNLDKLTGVIVAKLDAVAVAIGNVQKLARCGSWIPPRRPADDGMVLPLVKGNVWTYDYTSSWANDSRSNWEDSQGTYKVEIVDVKEEGANKEVAREQIYNGERIPILPITYNSTLDLYTFGPRTLDFAAERATFGGLDCSLGKTSEWNYMACPYGPTFTSDWSDQTYTGVFEYYVPGKGLTEYRRNWTIRGLFYWTNLDRL